MSDLPATSRNGLEMLDYAAVAFYLALTFFIAVWFSRRQKNTEDFFVGGRRMPWFAVGLSILATLFSTLSYLGMPGEMIKNGVGLFCGYLAVPFSFIVVMYLWVPFFMRLRLTSAYEYLERRFNSKVRTLGASLFVLLRLGWMSMVIFGASLALDRVKGDDLNFLPGPDLYWWVATIGIVAAVYTSLGGIQAVIWVDVLQCVLLLTGVLMAIGYVALIDGTGPRDWWATAALNSPKHTTPPVFSWDVTVRVTIFTAVLNNFFWTICTHGSDQVVLQRYFSTSSLRSARRSFLVNVIVDFMMACLLSLAGLALLSYYLKHSNLIPGGNPVNMADKLFPHFLGFQLPAGCAGLVMSAFLCDAIQTLESGVNAIAAVFFQDFVSPRRVPEVADPDEPQPDELQHAEPQPAEPQLTKSIVTYDAAMARLMTARKLSFTIALLVTMNAYWVAYLYEHYQLTIIEMMPKFFNMFVGPLAATFFVGMFLPRCTSRSTIPAVLCGLGVSILWSWWEVIFRTSVKPTFTLAIAVPCLTTIGIAALLSLFVERSGKHSGSDYTWWAILRDKKSEVD